MKSNILIFAMLVTAIATKSQIAIGKQS
ncbi:hypothetical protein SAMN05421679_1192, partial [Epilithonimonas pallida]